MPIQALSEDTNRLLGSAQVLTMAASLVKELLDNALDAKATSIDVVISANTLDKIEVRDNGHGIATEDLHALGRRGYTSKLRNFEGLRSLGGLSLGFRGEALASAVELGEVSISTRTEGEAVATAIKLKALGGIERQHSTSHPVGTTVCVHNFLSRLPVRKQHALKDAKKTVSRVKDLLQSYALARRNIRLTLKVLKSGKENWSFVPHPNDGIKEVVSQVIGRDTAAQCMEKITTLSGPHEGGAIGINPGTDQSISFDKDEPSQQRPQCDFSFHGFLPKPDADLLKVCGSQYISIDSRPVSCARGTLKKIIAIYKAHIWAIAADNISEKVKNPFIRLNIVCPVGSYDPNVEPAKDNVLFEDEPLLLSLAEDWFKSVYGDYPRLASVSKRTSATQDQGHDLPTVPNGVTRKAIHGYISPSTTTSFKTLKRPPIGDEQLTDLNVFEYSPRAANYEPDGGVFLPSPEVADNPQVRDKMKWGLDMSKDYIEDVDSEELSEVSIYDPIITKNFNIEEMPSALDGLNPWVIAKLNTPITENRAQEPRVPESGRRAKTKGPSRTPFKLPTPLGSSDPVSAPAPRHLSSAERSLRDSALDMENKKSSLENWLNQNRVTHFDSAEYRQICESTVPVDVDSIEAFANQGNIVTTGDMLHITPLSSPVTKRRSSTTPSRGPNKAFTSPLKGPQPTVIQIPWSQVHQATKLLPSHRPQYNEAPSDMNFDAEAQDNLHENVTHVVVEEALDFERRKEAATRRLRETLLMAQSRDRTASDTVIGITRSSPHKNRDHVAVTAQNACQNPPTSDTATMDKVPVETCLPDGDPRGYLMRRQRSTTAYIGRPGTGRPKRAKTMLLPLETIPDSAEVHSLVHIVTIDVSLVGKALLGIAGLDEYVKSGNQAMGLSVPAADLAAIKKRLESVVNKWVQVTKGEQEGIELELRGLQGRSVGMA